MKKTFFFGMIFGILLGIIPYITNTSKYAQPSQLDVCIAQILYEEMEFYKEYINVNAVLPVIKEFGEHARPLKGNKELHTIISEVHAKKAEAEAAASLAKAESFLNKLKEQSGVIPIIEDQVYIEVLESGNGEPVSLEDTVVLKYINHTQYGLLSKEGKQSESENNIFTIPLSRTIQGFRLGINGAKIGERRKIYIHPDLGFGNMGYVGPNCLLVFEVTLLEKKN